MMKSILSILFSLIVLSACSGADQAAPTTDDPALTNGATGLHQTSGQQTDKEALFAARLVKLLLGGALKGQLTYEQLPTIPVVQGKAASISTGFDSDSSTFEKEITFPSIYLSASGAYDRIQSEGAAGPVYYVDPVSISLMFNDLDRELSGETVTLNGNLHCEIEGHYTVETKKFLGEGFCTSESADGDTILVTANSGTKAVRLNAAVEIHGEALDLNSILATGNVLIDDNGYVIEDLPSSLE